MELHIFTNNENIIQMYEMVNTNGYSFNLYFIKDEIIEPRSILDIDLGIQCTLKKFNNSIKSMQLYTYEPFWIIPNKFITKTPLISQNSPNLVEPQENGTNLIISLFNNSDKPYKITTGMSLFKIVTCSGDHKINKINLN
jgi:hypothetical protein